MALLCLCLNAQVGSLDHTFNASGTPGFRIDNPTGFPDKYDIASAMAFTSDGKIIVAGRVENDNNFLLLRYTAAGALDNTFGTGGIVWVSSVSARAYGMAVQPDGKLVLVGWITPANRDFCIMRFNSDGSLDAGFGTGGQVVTPIGTENDEARNVAIQSDGKIVVTGFSTNAAHNTDFVVVRYTSSGSLDGSFGTGGIVKTDINNFDAAEGIAINSTTGAITIAGSSNEDSQDPNYSNTGSGDFTVVRYTSAGALDGSFGVGGKAIFDIGAGTYDEAHSLAVQPDGKLVVAGITKRGSTNSGNSDAAVIRLTTAGALDGTFGTAGKAIANYTGFNSDDDCHSVTLQNDGKIVIGGSVDAFTDPKPYGFMLMRFTTAGALDVTFDGDGKAAVDLAPTDNDFGYVVALNGNRIYLAGTSGDPRDLAIAAFQNDATALPLVLTQFYGQKQTSNVVLRWTTSSEENIAQYVVERSSDGKAYKAIGTVAAAGNSNTARNYSFADQSPFANTNNYYRLRMQDVDGGFTYSNILIIKFSTALTTSLQIFPNPVKKVLQVQIPSGFTGNTSLQVFDLSGQLVKVNRINSDGNALNTTIDLTSLSTGVYMLKATDGNTSVITRFVKQ
jgi:uncharacterized delta-60 repeat protein